MNTNDCQDVEALLGPYLDSELDTKTSLEIGLHLKECPACTARLAEETAWHRKLQAGLSAGAPTEGLWEPIEERIRELSRPTSIATGPGDASMAGRPCPGAMNLPGEVGRAVPGAPAAAGWGQPALPATGTGASSAIRALFPALQGWRYWLWPSPRLYAGLAAAWALIIGIQIGIREPGPVSAPPAPETRTALAEQRHLLAELLGMELPEDEPVGTPPPQTDIRRPVRNLPT